MYIKIFNEIVSILHNDYAGCFDKRGWDNPEFYRKEISEMKQPNDERFVEIVQDYLLDFRDLHMKFKHAAQLNQSSKDVGFEVRRYKDFLYIVSCDKENRVKPGYVISALDGVSISELVSVHKRQLMENEAERENWSSILPRYKTATVQGDYGTTFILELSNHEKNSYHPEYTLKEMTEDTILLTLTDFMNHNAISNLINENESLLSTCKNLIIDVRVNKGGSDLAYFDLLPFLFDGKEIDLTSFNEGTMLTNCTTRNVELRTQLLKGVLGSIDDEKTRNQLNSLIKSLEGNKGKGFVELNSAEMNEDLVLKTKPGPENVILLTDVYCGSSGDSFVEICINSSKVTVIGRPTLGLNDYANIAIMEWENKFDLLYPTSKLSIVDEGMGMSGVGIQPDIYIPWTPNHIEEDLDLRKAFELMEVNALY